MIFFVECSFLIVLANGSLSSNTSNEGEIRKNMLEADLVDGE
ncbi:hypothetical protein [Niallia sp. MER 6]|nr:hypothetical protein [Niallia sp. MER 6]